MSNHRTIFYLFLSFAGGVLVATGTPYLVRASASRVFFPEHLREVERVTSPDYVVDAVMEVTDCGAPCSLGYFVSIVPKGTVPSANPRQRVFFADDLVNGSIRWGEPHLLDITYDKALINDFKNLTYPLGRSGDEASWRYAVEVRLRPTSPHYSYLSDREAQVSP